MLGRASVFVFKNTSDTAFIKTHSSYAPKLSLLVGRGAVSLSRNEKSQKLVSPQEHTRVLCSTICSTAKSSPPNFQNKLLRKIKSSINGSGPMTVAEYMRLVLTNYKHGYYMQHDVFGSKGDFTTSPEISQMFGELIGIWCVNEWMHCGQPSPFNVVELGPGRGTLADDMLRVFKKFPKFNEAINLHFIEISPKMREMQQEKLCLPQGQAGVYQAVSGQTSSQDSLTTKTGVKVHWWNDLAELPHGPSFYVAHEFFDALPIHKFQKVDGKWREVLVDYHEDQLRFVLAPADTVASALLKDHLHKHPGDHVEISAQGLQIIRELATRIHSDGGFALIIDYGHFGEKGDTFRAFSKHHLVDPLKDPGFADLTADVNFELLRSQCLDKVGVYGPTSQSQFLGFMGIALRLKVLLEKASQEQQKDLISGYNMLTNPDEMGERFKFMAMMNVKNFPKDYKPAGFEGCLS